MVGIYFSGYKSLIICATDLTNNIFKNEIKYDVLFEPVFNLNGFIRELYYSLNCSCTIFCIIAVVTLQELIIAVQVLR